MVSAMHLRTAEFLWTEDVASWQAVDVTTQKTFATTAGYNVWKRCAELQFPYLFGDISLYEGHNRQVLLRCHARMLRANYSLGDILVIDDVGDAAFLSEQLRDSLRACADHPGASGQHGHGLFGEFDLTRSFCATSFEFGVNGKSKLAGLPAGMLKLFMVLEGDSLMACARYGSGRVFSFLPLVEAEGVHLKMDVTSADQRVAMSVRGMSLTLDGTWRSSGPELRFEDHLNCQMATSVFCVLTLTDSLSTIVDASSSERS
eukprot:TRINITY_DN6460_c0_g3_i2.p1 TRINITY_DN6460_c0_g3~~TRINITY_DN6460_c0_g3_i2.p1  ORF type:complete len:260 (-),score=41.92 TRINITY_DN6460_c0_g3_i2:332-1111(-)